MNNTLLHLDIFSANIQHNKNVAMTQWQRYHDVICCIFVSTRRSPGAGYPAALVGISCTMAPSWRASFGDVASWLAARWWRHSVWGSFRGLTAALGNFCGFAIVRLIAVHLRHVCLADLYKQKTKTMKYWQTAASAELWGFLIYVYINKQMHIIPNFLFFQVTLWLFSWHWKNLF